MDEDSRTIFIGNLSSRCSESILFELFFQGGPVEKVNIPKDRDGSQKSFGFVTYKHAISVPYALRLFEGTSLYSRTLTLQARQCSEQDVPVPPRRQAYEYDVQPLPYNMPSHNYNQPYINLGQQMYLGSLMNPNMGGIMPLCLPMPNMAQYPNQGHAIHTNYEDRRPMMDRSRESSSRNHPYHQDRDREKRDRFSDRGHRSHRDHRSHDHNRYNNSRNYR